MSRRLWTSTDSNSLAVRKANMTMNGQPPADDRQDLAAVALGRAGGLKGGKTRAAKITPEERTASAQKAEACWGKNNEDS